MNPNNNQQRGKEPQQSSPPPGAGYGSPAYPYPFALQPTWFPPSPFPPPFPPSWYPLPPQGNPQGNSQVNSQGNSQNNSQNNSQGNSQNSNSQGNSQSNSQGNSQSNSQVNSQSNSQSNSQNNSQGNSQSNSQLPTKNNPPSPPKHDHNPPHKKPEKYTDHKPTVRIYCKAKLHYSLTIHGGKVILAPANARDHHQHWIQDVKHSSHIKDAGGQHSFALVNKATGQALKHSIGVTYPVQLTHYNPDKLDKSILWSRSTTKGAGYTSIRAVDNVHLHLTGKEGTKKKGGSHDGTKVVQAMWTHGDNQLWHIMPY